MEERISGELALAEARLAADFQAVRLAPEAVAVQFSGGHVSECVRVTRSDGDYSVVWMPRAGSFSLCVESVFGPLDIGVHGRALDCFGSV
jgi:hypothetical protein